MVCVIGSGGKPLMPTNIKRARRLLGMGRAVIAGHRPFTIRLLDREDGDTQPIEYKCDTGYQHVGVSICTEKRELVSEEYDLLPDETERHDTCRRNRRNRRGRKRHRAPRFDNRKGMICEDGFAPGIRNRRDRQIDIFLRYRRVMPITDAVFEMGQFDTQALAAVDAGKPVPQGREYQRGPRYGFDTLRAAVFARDGHTCQVCGRGIKDGAILRVHHLGYLTGDHTDRMGNLLTVCTKCHTPRNHRPGGKLHGLKPKLRPFRGATFMSAVRWDMLGRLKEAAPDVAFHVTYGVATRRARVALNIAKGHANDAYAMGALHPRKRERTVRWRKRRRNNRVLEKFHDAVYIDVRDGARRKGAELPCGRARRCESRLGAANERVYRAMRAVRWTRKGFTVSRGRRSIRTRRYGIQPGDIVLCENRRAVAGGMHNKGGAVMVDGRSVAISKVRLLRHADGWIPAN